MNNYENYSLQNICNEHWLPVAGYESRYMVSNFGRMKSISRIIYTKNGTRKIQEKIMHQRNRNGYLCCKSINVHRAVARAFVINLQCKKYVNHKDGNKKNNIVSNLEWVTAKENVDHAWFIGLMNDETKSKMSQKAKLRTGNKNPCWRGRINILSMDGSFIHQTESMQEAELWIKVNTIFTKASKANICNVCNGKLNSAYGYKYSIERVKNAGV